MGGLCQVLGISWSGYYAWLGGRETARELVNRLLAEQIKSVYTARKGNY